jgi:hypothetical protein
MTASADCIYYALRTTLKVLMLDRFKNAFNNSQYCIVGEHDAAWPCVEVCA